MGVRVALGPPDYDKALIGNIGGVMGETLIVRAIVPKELREQFEIWYEEEHLAEAHKAFGSYQAYRGWDTAKVELANSSGKSYIEALQAAAEITHLKNKEN